MVVLQSAQGLVRARQTNLLPAKSHPFPKVDFRCLKGDHPRAFKPEGSSWTNFFYYKRRRGIVPGASAIATEIPLSKVEVKKKKEGRELCKL